MHRVYDWGTREWILVSLPSHNEIIEDLFLELESKGEDPRCDVGLVSGHPDLVTDTHIYEIKPELTLAAMQKAIGQLVLYGAELPDKQLVIVGYAESGVQFQASCERLGIEVIAYKNDTWEYRKRRHRITAKAFND